MSKHRKSPSESGRTRGRRHGGPGQPSKCPDCGTWFVSEHRCEAEPIGWQIVSSTETYWLTSVVLCSCSPYRGELYSGHCPVHDVQTTPTYPSVWYA